MKSFSGAVLPEEAPGAVLIGGGLTMPDGRPPCLGVVSKEFRPALVKAEGGSRRGPWLRFERALSG